MRVYYLEKIVLKDGKISELNSIIYEMGYIKLSEILLIHTFSMLLPHFFPY